MQLYTAIERGYEQIHIDSLFTAYLITIGNCRRKLARGRLSSWDIFKVSTGVYLKSKMAEKVTKVVCKYIIKKQNFPKHIIQQKLCQQISEKNI